MVSANLAAIQPPDMVRHIRSRHPQIRQHLITNGSWNFPKLLEAIIHGRVHTRFSLHAGDVETWQNLHPRDDIRSFAQETKT